MNCTRCEEALLQRTERVLDPEITAAVERHVARCDGCSDLVRLLERERSGELVAPEDLVAEVLRASIGDTGLGAAVRRLDTDLPALAALEPGPDFTVAVLAATTGGPPGLGARLLAVWDRVVERPRFALQCAYAAAMVVFLLVGLPSSPLADLPRETSSLIADPERGAVRQVSAMARRAGELGVSTWHEAGDLVERAREVPAPAWLPAWPPEPDSRSAALGRWATSTWDAHLAPLLERWRPPPPDSPRPSPEPDPEQPDASNHSV